MSIVNRIVSTAKGAARNGAASGGRRPAGRPVGGAGRRRSGRDQMVEKGVRGVLSQLRRRGR